MALIPGNLLGKLPRIDETEGIPYKDLMCVIRLFNPIGKETWYVIEYDPEKELAFGFGVFNFEGGLITEACFDKQ